MLTENTRFQDDGQLSFHETEDEEHLIPKSWKDHSYVSTDKSLQKSVIDNHKAQCFLHHTCTDNCKERDIVPDATSTPKRKREKQRHAPSKVSFQNIESISRPSTELQETTEKSKLLPDESRFKRYLLYIRGRAMELGRVSLSHFFHNITIFVI